MEAPIPLQPLRSEIDERPEVLDSGEKEVFRNNFTKYFESVYEGDIYPDRFNDNYQIFSIISLPPEDKTQIALRKITPRLSAIAVLFLQELITFIKSKIPIIDRDRKFKLSVFLGNISEGFFSEYGALELVSLAEAINFSSIVANIPEAYSLHNVTIEEFFRGMQFGKAIITPEILLILCKDKKSTAEILDVIHFLEMLALRIIGKGKDFTDEPGYKSIKDAIELFRNESDIVFILYAADLALKRIQKEEAQTPASVTVVNETFEERTSRKVRGEDQLKRVEHERIAYRINPEGYYVPYGEPFHFFQIASDTIAAADEYDIPRSFSICDGHQLAEALPQPLWIEAVRFEWNFFNEKFPHDMQNNLAFVYESIFAVHYGKRFFDVLHKAVPQLEKEEWERYFYLLMRLRKIKNDVQQFEEKIFQEERIHGMQKFINDVSLALQHSSPELISCLPESELKLLKDRSSDKFYEVWAAALKLAGIASVFERTRQQALPTPAEKKKASFTFGILSRDYNRTKGDYEAIYASSDQQIDIFRAKMEKEASELRPEFTVLDEKVTASFLAVREGFLTLFSDVERELAEHLIPVHFERYESIAANDTLNPFPQPDDKNLPLLLEHLHSPRLRQAIEEDLGCRLTDIPLRSQIHLLHFLQTKNKATFERLRNVLQSHPKMRPQILYAFLASAGDTEFGNVILDLAENHESHAIFHEYAGFVQNAEAMASNIVEAVDNVDYKEIYRAFLQRGKHLLEEAKLVLADSDLLVRQASLAKLTRDLGAESSLQSAMRSFALSLTAVLQGKDVDLRRYEKIQKQMVANFDELHLGTVLLKGFHARGMLASVPEIHWRVDRTSEEYNRRFGFDVQQFLGYFAKAGQQQLLLEFGPGNGTFKKERREAAGGYIDLAICDKLYYPLNKLIGNLLDFEKLEKTCGPISDQEKDVVCDFLYRILVIKEGQTALDHFEYDRDVIEAIQQNPNQLLQHLLRKAPLLKITDVVPQTISTRDREGKVMYPYKLQKPQTESFRKMCNELASNFQNYLVAPLQNLNIYDYIPAYPAGTIVGDFRDIKNLGAGQLDVALDVRSTVYYRDQNYIDLMKNIASKLSADGIYIGDSLRDNDGWYYRIAELQEVQKATEMVVHVILGKGFEGEDFNQDEMVPLVVVLTKDEQKLRYVEEHLNSGFQLKKLDDIANDSSYLARLDAAGNVLRKVTEWRDKVLAA